MKKLYNVISVLTKFNDLKLYKKSQWLLKERERIGGKSWYLEELNTYKNCVYMDQCWTVCDLVFSIGNIIYELNFKCDQTHYIHRFVLDLNSLGYEIRVLNYFLNFSSNPFFTFAISKCISSRVKWL